MSSDAANRLGPNISTDILSCCGYLETNVILTIYKLWFFPIQSLYDALCSDGDATPQIIMELKVTLLLAKAKEGFLHCRLIKTSGRGTKLIPT